MLRSHRGVSVAESSVGSLSAQSRDVANLVAQGRGIRNDLLAAQVARANASSARSRPATGSASRGQRTIATSAGRSRRSCPGRAGPRNHASRKSRHGRPGPARTYEPIAADETQLRALCDRALANRSELVSLSEQAHSTYTQASAERAKTRPQVSFLVANLYQNARFLPTEADTGAAAFVLNWTIFDGGKSPPFDGDRGAARRADQPPATTSPRKSNSRCDRHG